MRNQWTNIKGFAFFGLIFLFVFMADILVVYFYFQATREFIAGQPKNKKADAAIIFFGDYTNRGTRLGPDSKNRAQKAISLYRQGLFGSIVCVGGYDLSKWKDQPHLMKQYLVDNGIPGHSILHDSLSFNTISNWQEALKIMKTNHFDTVIAISSPLHIYRISRIIRAENVLYDAYEYHPASLPEYWQIFKDVHHEFASIFLSYALKDKVRNRIVRIYRTLWSEFNRVL